MDALISQIYFWNKILHVFPQSGVFHCTYSNGLYHTGLLTKISASSLFYYKNLSRCTVT